MHQVSRPVWLPEQQKDCREREGGPCTFQVSRAVCCSVVTWAAKEREGGPCELTAEQSRAPASSQPLPTGRWSPNQSISTKVYLSVDISTKVYQPKMYLSITQPKYIDQDISLLIYQPRYINQKYIFLLIYQPKYIDEQPKLYLSYVKQVLWPLWEHNPYHHRLLISWWSKQQSNIFPYILGWPISPLSVRVDEGG